MEQYLRRWNGPSKLDKKRGGISSATVAPSITSGRRHQTGNAALDYIRLIFPAGRSSPNISTWLLSPITPVIPSLPFTTTSTPAGFFHRENPFKRIPIRIAYFHSYLFFNEFGKEDVDFWISVWGSFKRKSCGILRHLAGSCGILREIRNIRFSDKPQRGILILIHSCSCSRCWINRFII